VEGFTDSALNALGHFHPALVHFPVALLLAGAAVEFWHTMRKHDSRSSVGRFLLICGTLGALLAVASGLSLFHPEDFRGRTLQVATIHRLLGIGTASAAVLTLILGGLDASGPTGKRLLLYRLLYALTGLFVGLAGHYGGWVVFGWGRVWTF